MRPLPAARADYLISWFTSLEEELVRFLRMVPPQGANLNAWSPTLATIIVEACGLIDSMYRQLSPARTKKRKDLDLGDYFKQFGHRRRLPSRKVILLTQPPAYRIPFAGWSEAKAPGWWTTHNRLKHHRLDHARRATSDTAIDALAGALVTMSTTPELVRALLSRGWLETGYLPTAIGLEVAESEFKVRSGLQAEMTVDTLLFAVPLGSKPLPADASDFAPREHGGSARLGMFFGRWP